VTGKIDVDTWNALTSNFPEAVLTSYTISDEDVAGSFDKRIACASIDLTPKIIGESLALAHRFPNS
jgi:hypothetical protein